MSETRDHHRFCSKCAGVLELKPCDGRDRPVCGECGHIVYINPIPCVAAVLVRDGRVLLVKRNIDPGKGMWCLPAGFMEWGESPECSTIREVGEETGLDCTTGRLLTVRSEIIELYGHVIILAYEIEQAAGELHPGDDADDARFFPLDNLPRLAFRTHHDIMQIYAKESTQHAQTSR